MIRTLPYPVRLAYEYRQQCPCGSRLVDARSVIAAFESYKPLPQAAAEAMRDWHAQRVAVRASALMAQDVAAAFGRESV